MCTQPIGGIAATQTIPALAAEASAHFSVSLDPGRPGRTYVHTHHAPEWVQTMVRDAHGTMLPDDYVYSYVRDALAVLADSGAAGEDHDDLVHDFADGVDTYTGQLTAWLASHANRVGFCDEAADELGADYVTITSRIQLGQYWERRNVFASVLESLRGQLEEA